MDRHVFLRSQSWLTPCERLVDDTPPLLNGAASFHLSMSEQYQQYLGVRPGERELHGGHLRVFRSVAALGSPTCLQGVPHHGQDMRGCSRHVQAKACDGPNAPDAIHLYFEEREGLDAAQMVRPPPRSVPIRCNLGRNAAGCREMGFKWTLLLLQLFAGGASPTCRRRRRRRVIAMSLSGKPVPRVVQAARVRVLSETDRGTGEPSTSEGGFTLHLCLDGCAYTVDKQQVRSLYSDAKVANRLANRAGGRKWRLERWTSPK
jgi:hypothetical protein